jgi:hypothetical protein
MTVPVADRIEIVRDELTSIRRELAATGSSPHAAAHDLVKEVQKVFVNREGDLSVYLRELRS